MSVEFLKDSKEFVLQTKNTTYQIQVGEYDVLYHLYYGDKIDTTSLSYIIQKADRGFSGNPYECFNDRTFSLDILPQEYPTYGVGDYRTSCIMVKNHDGSNGVDLRYVSHKIYDGKYKLQGLPATYVLEDDKVQTLEILLEDKISNVQVTLLYGVFEEKDTITRATIIKNNSKNTIRLEKALSTCLDFDNSEYDLINFYGKHAMEREVERLRLRHGKQSIGSIRGTSSHHHNPFIILADKNATEEFGECYGVSLLYSGNFIGEVEVDQINQTRVVMGIHPDNFSFVLNESEEFITPEVAMIYSKSGLATLSQKYHELYRNNLCRGKYKNIRRPILINNWEATYFDFNEEKIYEIAKSACELGVEMLVMDDGWFGKRDDDNSGLGDWVVNENKIKGGLNKLVNRINSLGMKFGIWFEPEMISEDSDLYRSHSEWTLKMPNRPGNRSRNQFVLDVSRKDVVDYLYESLSRILDSANIEYVKWDMNRSICNVWSACLPIERQGEVYHRYVLGLYDLLERLTSKYPNILFEGCSGGGGRFDAGMLYYTPQIWCSDNTDAIERIKIQYGTSFGYPISAVGSHVSAVPNHQTGRVTPLETRGVVAMAGSFGYELDISKMTEDEKVEVKRQIEEFKEVAEVIHNGDYYRLSNPYENLNYAAWEFVSKDKNEALLSLVITHALANAPFICVKLKGLDPNKRYKINNGEKVLYSGDALMKAGFPIKQEIGEFIGKNYHIKSV